MIQFRGSAAGYCTRQIVMKQLEPGRFEVDPARRPFLDAGHYLQQHVEDFLVEVGSSPILLTDMRESEGTYSEDDWSVVGHIDGMFDDRTLLEVKAIKTESFDKLAKSYDWRENYGHYQSQAQTYQRMFNATGTHFIYYNRNTSEMMGSLKINHPAYVFRKDMFEPHDPTLWNMIRAKFQAAADFVREGEAPPECDAKGYCYFCGVRGTETQKKRVKPISLFPDDEEYQEITEAMANYEAYRDGVAHLFKEFNATEIHLVHGGQDDTEILRKEDYE